jgi:flagellar basal body-associated protein FliL
MTEEVEDDAPDEVQKKRRLPKPVRNILISAGVLLVLLVAGGVAYTYYMDQNSKNALATTTPVAQQTPQQVKPVQPAANALEGVAINVLSSPAAQGSNAMVSIQTLASSKCTISVVYGTVPAVDSGLVPKTADPYGSVTWSWTISPTAPIGTWPVKITCVRNGKTGFVEGSLQVTKS